mmetsp:Transcript_40187/g.87678  ORF Transcript_40187/g.87678 Transcript_40187/m.87678 type:complete len:277 (+) Transcript_40187:1724-2554(+)
MSSVDKCGDIRVARVLRLLLNGQLQRLPLSQVGFVAECRAQHHSSRCGSGNCWLWVTLRIPGGHHLKGQVRHLPVDVPPHADNEPQALLDLLPSVLHRGVCDIAQLHTVALGVDSINPSGGVQCHILPLRGVLLHRSGVVLLRVAGLLGLAVPVIIRVREGVRCLIQRICLQLCIELRELACLGPHVEVRLCGQLQDGAPESALLRWRGDGHAGVPLGALMIYDRRGMHRGLLGLLCLSLLLLLLRLGQRSHLRLHLRLLRRLSLLRLLSRPALLL